MSLIYSTKRQSSSIIPPLPRYSSTFMTVESMLSMNGLHEIEDSESDEEDLDFGGYSQPKLTGILNNFSSNSVILKSSTLPMESHQMKQKHDRSITISSFQNFRIQSLTIISMDAESIYDIDDMDDDDYKALELMGIFEEKEIDFDDEEIDKKESNIVDLMMSDLGSFKKSDTKSMDIRTQLMAFGYAQSDIIKAIKCAINKSDINEIKNILDNDQLHQQNKASKNIKFIEAEIIKTEQTYCTSLDILINEMIETIFKNGFVERKYYKQIRSTLPKIFCFHCLFLEKLKNAKNGSLIDVFNECFMKNKQNVIDMYTEYIHSYDVILDLFGITFHGNCKLDNFLKEKRKEKKPISSYLILPVQRIPRYILLLSEYKKNTKESNTEFMDIENAVNMIHDIAERINEKKRKIENLSQCLQIQSELNGLNEPIVDDERYFLKQFVFIKKEIKHQRLFFLFNDIVIIANQKWNVKHVLAVQTLEVKIVKNEKKILPEFELLSVGIGCALYIGQDVETINCFKQMIEKCRANLIHQHLQKQNGQKQ